MMKRIFCGLALLSLIFSGILLPGSPLHADEPTENISEIGDYVWLDTNGDGIQNDEPGVPGVVLNLFRWDDDTHYTYIGQTVTDQDGHYFFDELPMGNYQLQIIFRLGDLSPMNQGDDPNLDSDFNEAGYSPIFLLGARNVQYNHDAGLLRRPPPPVDECDHHGTCWFPIVSTLGT